MVVRTGLKKIETKKKAAGGRPRKEIDFEQFEKICAFLPTAEEVASFLGVSVDTLNRRLKEKYNDAFPELVSRFGGRGKLRLRRILWKQAQKSPAIAIFLAKNYLGMSDKPDTAIEQIDGLRFIEE